MNSVLIVRVIRCIGWAALAGSIGVVGLSSLIASLAGPVEGQAIWPTARLWRYFFASVAMAGMATLLATLLAIPAVIALSQTRRFHARRILYSLVILPLVLMPGIFAYAWMLLATRQGGWAARLMDVVGWNTPGWEWVQAAWVLATWLWPIPALVMAVSYIQLGRMGFQLARLDSSNLIAFFRGAMPLMRAPLFAALSIVFILAINESTVPPLMSASEVWSVEVMAQASAALGRASPMGFLIWNSWPMLLLVGLITAAAIPGLRVMAGWAESLETGDTGMAAGGARHSWWIAVLIAASITMFPIGMFTLELSSGRAGIVESIETAYRTFRRDGLATGLVGVLTALSGFAAALAVISDPSDPTWRRCMGRVAVGFAVISAMLPPELSGTALATFYSRISNPLSRWSVYDCTPLVWTAATLARYAFLPMVVANLLNRRVPESLLAQARVDGSDGSAVLTRVRLPYLWKSVAIGATVAGCMALSEVAATTLVQPPRFFGGSLAVKVDMQMHYGRQDETIALAMMMFLPAMLGAWIAPTLSGKVTAADGE